MRTPAFVLTLLALAPLAAAAQSRQATQQQPVTRQHQVDPTVAVAPQRATLMVRRDTADRRAILRADVTAGAEAIFYRTNKDVVYEVAVSSDNRYTAAIESRDGTVRDGEYVVPPRDTLVILDSSGGVVRRVDDVQRYVFSPDGKSIAYVLGTYYEGGVGFRPGKVYVMEIASGRAREVAADSVYEINWVQAEGRDELYLRRLDRAPERRVMRYDVPRRQVSAVPSGAFHFSPDGAYYLTQPYEELERGRCDRRRQTRGGCFTVFEHRSGRPVAGLAGPEAGRPLGWAYNDGHRLLFTKVQATARPTRIDLGKASYTIRRPPASAPVQTTVWDVRQARAVQSFRGATTLQRQTGRWITGGGELVVRPRLEAQVLSEPAARSLELRRVDDGGGG